MRLRTVPKAAKLLHEEDPDTPLSEKVLHRLIKQGHIKPVYVGNLAYIDVDRRAGQRNGRKKKSH